MRFEFRPDPGLAIDLRNYRLERVRRYVAATTPRGRIVELDGQVIYTNQFAGEIK